MERLYYAVYEGQKENQIVGTPLGTNDFIRGEKGKVTGEIMAESDDEALQKARALKVKGLQSLELKVLYRCEPIDIPKDSEESQ